MVEEINIKIGYQLRHRRVVLGLSQEALGNKIGVASQQVQKYEKGTNSLNAARLYEFATHLEVPISYFFEKVEKDTQKHDPLKILGEDNGYASGREAIETMKSFRKIKDKALRKRVADLLKTMSTK